MTTQCEIRIVRCTDGTIDLEMCEFNAEGKISNHIPWEECWFSRFLGGERGELSPWLKDQFVSMFTTGYTSALNAGWMAETTTMIPKEPPCTTLVLCGPKH